MKLKKIAKEKELIQAGLPLFYLDPDSTQNAYYKQGGANVVQGLQNFGVHSVNMVMHMNNPALKAFEDSTGVDVGFPSPDWSEGLYATEYNHGKDHRFGVASAEFGWSNLVTAATIKYSTQSAKPKQYYKIGDDEFTITIKGGKRGTSQSVILGDKADTAIQKATRIPVEEGYYDVIAHGSEDSITVYSASGKIHKDVSARALARYLEKYTNYEGGPVRLLSCNTGRNELGFAYNLSFELQENVLAPNNILWAPSGKVCGTTFDVSGNPIQDDTIIGWFELFSPF